MKILRTSPAVILAAVFICYFICSLFMPFLGDDLAHSYRLIEQNDCWYAIPRSFYRHWLFGNARTADMLLPLFLNYLPAWALATVNGAFTAAWFYLVARLGAGSLRNYAAATAIMFILMFGMRWDALWMEFNTQCNYIWSSAAALAAVCLILSTRSRLRLLWLTVPFCFIAGASHEACGFPLAAGLTAWLASGAMTRLQSPARFNAFSFIAGGVFTLTSPGSLNRVGAVLQPEPWLGILIFSGGFVVLLALASISLLAARRALFLRLLHSPWLIFAVAAAVSCCFMLFSRFGGRTGWFAQTFALIALAMMVRQLSLPRIPHKAKAMLTAGMSVCMVAECAATAVWQTRLGTETASILKEYAASPDGVVFSHYTSDTEVPLCVRRRVHGLPDPDDTYYLYRIAEYIGEGRPLVVLPPDSRLPQPPFEAFILADGSILAADTLAGRYNDALYENFPRTMIRVDGKEYIETRFSHNGAEYVLYSAVDRDRGEK